MKIVFNIGNLHGVASTRPSKKLVIGLIEEVSIGEAMAEANARVAVIVLSIVCGEKLIVSGSASTKGLLKPTKFYVRLVTRPVHSKLSSISSY